MRYKCLVFDHDDTVVNSTATIHFPSFRDYLKIYRPGCDITLEEYFSANFAPGFIPMCVERYGMTDECGLLVNSSRGIIYASSGTDFAEAAAAAARQVQEQMAEILTARGL